MLSELYKNDGISQKMLAENSYKDAPTTSRIIDLLAKKDLLRRDEVENNRRQYQVYISKKGKKTVEKAIPIVNEIRIEGWMGLNDKDYDSLLRILETLASNFDGMNEKVD